jgi:hypothetical protein
MSNQYIAVLIAFVFTVAFSWLIKSAEKVQKKDLKKETKN